MQKGAAGLGCLSPHHLGRHKMQISGTQRLPAPVHRPCGDQGRMATGVRAMTPWVLVTVLLGKSCHGKDEKAKNRGQGKVPQVPVKGLSVHCKVLNSIPGHDALNANNILSFRVSKMLPGIVQCLLMASSTPARTAPLWLLPPNVIKESGRARRILKLKQKPVREDNSGKGICKALRSRS